MSRRRLALALLASAVLTIAVVAAAGAATKVRTKITIATTRRPFVVGGGLSSSGSAVGIIGVLSWLNGEAATSQCILFGPTE